MNTVMSFITTDLNLAVKSLQQSEIVAIPTETVYGLAANAEEESAIKKIFALKNRPLNHPLIMHIAANWDLSPWVENVPDYVSTLMAAFWPGPLTLILPCKPGGVSPLVNGGQTTLAIRCPNHPIAEALLTTLGKPLVAPSANPFGKISPTTAYHVQQSFPDDPLLILDGGRCGIGIESTIIAATDPRGYQILRHGVIDENALEAVLPQKRLEVTSTVRVPGRLDTHYQPEKPLYCIADYQHLLDFCTRQSLRPFILAFSKNDASSAFPSVQLTNDPSVCAYELYFQLRAADLRANVDILVMEMPPETTAWQGIRERVLKAGRIV